MPSGDFERRILLLGLDPLLGDIGLGFPAGLGTGREELLDRGVVVGPSSFRVNLRSKGGTLASSEVLIKIGMVQKC